MKIIIDKNKTKIKTLNVNPTDDGFEITIVVFDYDIANNLTDALSKVKIEYTDEDNSFQRKDPRTAKNRNPQIAENNNTDYQNNDLNNNKNKYIISDDQAYSNNSFENPVKNEDYSKIILLAEDNPMINKTISSKLKRSGYNVISSSDGEDAIKKILENLPDIIITDILMPFASGMEIIEYVRKKLRLSLPIIVLSSLEDEDSVLTAFKLGADDYLTKPFNPEELLIRVKRLLMQNNVNKVSQHALRIS